MFQLDWKDPQTLWLNLTNLALGVITLAAILIVAGGVAWELVWKRRRARDLDGLDAEMQTMLQAGSRHIAPVPELGLTMSGWHRGSGAGASVTTPSVFAERPASGDSR